LVRSREAIPAFIFLGITRAMVGVSSSIDLRLHGVTFEDALKRILAAPPPPQKRLKKAMKKGGKNPARN
jgi:hypothetical protein